MGAATRRINMEVEIRRNGAAADFLDTILSYPRLFFKVDGADIPLLEKKLSIAELSNT